MDPMHEEEALGKAIDRQLVRRLWPFVAPYKGHVLATLLIVLPLFAVEVAPAWIVKNGLDRALGQGGEGDPFAALLEPRFGLGATTWLALVYLATAVAGAGVRYVHLLLMAATGQYAMRDLRRRVFEHMQRLHIGFFDRFPVGRLVTRVTNDVENVAEMFSAGIVALVTDVLVMIGFAVVLFWVNPKLALATFAVVPFLALAAVVFRLKVREAFRMVRVRIARINAHIQETITGMKVVQLFTREERNLRDFDAMNADHRDAWQMSIRYDALLFAAVEAAQNVTIAVIIWYGTGLAEAGVLYVFIDYMRRFFMPLRDLSAKYSVMQSSMASCERIFQLLDTEPDVADPPEPARVPRHPGSGSVEFQNVWFAYQGEDWVLRDLSFRVEPGEKVAFVGATGAGKTTIIKLLTRIYDVDRGRILVDGVDVREMAQQDLRRRVATVLQDVVLFSGSVADNIALGREDIDPATVRRCARSVEAHSFIERLPQGYDTPVRERGSNFSAGQRQLLSFARALAHGAEILVLDEATSSIDTETEALVQKGIHVLMENQTSIAIAHRLSTIRDVDRIYVLDGGGLVEAGAHDELMAGDGLYARLYRLQAQSEAAPSIPLGEDLAATGAGS
ncbi:MAG: ABC transporter ATP-binding protein [Myxococcota bacterium]